jgi:hypothetical protein
MKQLTRRVITVFVVGVFTLAAFIMLSGSVQAQQRTRQSRQATIRSAYEHGHRGDRWRWGWRRIGVCAGQKGSDPRTGCPNDGALFCSATRKRKVSCKKMPRKQLQWI